MPAFARPVLFLLAMLLCAAVQAQSGATLQNCLLRTPEALWTELKLTPDQRERVKHVQEACKDECEATGARKPADSLSEGDGSTVLAEMKAILNKEQHDAWMAHCARD